MTIKEILVDKLSTLLIFAVIVIGLYFVVTNLLCTAENEPYQFNNVTTIFEDDPIIVPDTLPYWTVPDSIIPISEVVATTEEGDEAHIVITYDPDSTVVVSGTINGNPITNADVQIIHPVIPRVYREELGNVAGIVHQSLTEPQTTLVGVSYEPLHLCHGKVRFGLQAAVNVQKWDSGMIGARIAGRKGNVSIGLGIGTNIPEFTLNTGVGLGFYF